MDKHDLLVKLKDMAIELGRVPTRDEFVKEVRGGKRLIADTFGTYAALCLAAGFNATERVMKARKINNSIFEVDIEKHLENYTPRIPQPKIRYPRMAIINDIHFPFHAEHVLLAFLNFLELWGDTCEYVIINGDLFDRYSHAKFPRSHNVFTPREEEKLARRLAEEFWREIQKRAPKAKCYLLLGNHDVRPLKRIIEDFPEAEDWIAQKMRDAYTFDGVETIHEFRQELQIADILIHHGYKNKLGDHRDHNLMNSISGHTHRPGVVYRTVRGSPIWEMNTGYAGDPNAKGLSYTATKTVDWVHAFGVVDEHGPRVVHV